DLVTCGVDEPYRMFTSRAEYRLLLRQDNADRRLTKLGYEVGLVSGDRWQRLQKKETEIAHARELLESNRTEGVTLTKYLRRPEVTWEALCSLLPELQSISADATQQVLYDVKYSGYVARQEQQVERQKRLVNKRIPETFDFATITQLRMEAKEKLTRVRPISLAQASRISGITPADVALLLAHLEGKRSR
ncbi:MAG TPA: tRNA uridine-5-carboxymethylaminomethyl(34) synthesis enzyme MnmG, partial [Pirellulaceae bacterium]|nr:tRNA uridine-5-carboxymethylaminomethyl(34) synthesis enzyme MnmG [Pirellulaceae bacterium]